MDFEEGPVYTKGNSFRARAEAAQRQYRSKVLGVGCGKYGHLLVKEAKDDGKNFCNPDAFRVAKERAALGKGVDVDRTFGNMLSSQAMCFNIFGLLTTGIGLEIANEVLSGYIKDMEKVSSVELEYTPKEDIFRDQSKIAGVDCDVLVKYITSDGLKGILVIETKFVESEFSVCGFRKKKKAGTDSYCSDDVLIKEDFSGCNYVSRKGYAYWQRCNECNTLRSDRLPAKGCPFSGPLWQLWVNHTLAHAVASGCDADRAVFAVCASEQNNALLRDPNPVNAFSRLVSDPSTVVFIPLEGLILRLAECVSRFRPEWDSWALELKNRYIVPED